METIGINQGAGGGENYPLIEPSNDIKGLIADLNLSIKRVKTAKVCIKWLYNFQNVISSDERADVVLGDEDTNTLWDTTENSTYEHHVWGADYHIFRWSNHDFHLTMVVRDSYLRPITTDISPVSAWLDIRTISCLAPHIYSVEVTDRYGVTHNIKNKKLIIESGYNVDLVPTKTTGIRESATIQIDAVAGAGMGRAPLSFLGIVPTEDGLLLKYLNGVTADDSGRVNLVGEEGYGIEMKEDEFHSMYVRNTDIPCCDCSLLDDLGTYIDEVVGKYYAIGGNAEHVRSELEKIIKKWETVKKKYPGITMASATVQGVSAACHRFTIRADITNKMPYPATISLNLGFTPMAIRTVTHSDSRGISETVVYKECDDYVEKSTYGVAPVPNSSSPNQVGDGVSSYSKSWSSVPPGASVSVQLLGTKKSRGNATVTASGTISGQGKTVSLVFYPASTITVESPCTGSPNELFDMTHPDYDDALLSDYYDYIWELRDSEYFKTDRKPTVREDECSDDTGSESSGGGSYTPIPR